MTHKNQMKLDSCHENVGGNSLKRAYVPPKLHHDLLQENTNTKAAFNSYEAPLTISHRVHVQGGPQS
jgi:hypothetical protein